MENKTGFLHYEIDERDLQKIRDDFNQLENTLKEGVKDVVLTFCGYYKDATIAAGAIDSGDFLDSIQVDAREYVGVQLGGDFVFGGGSDSPYAIVLELGRKGDRYPAYHLGEKAFDKLTSGDDLDRIFEARLDLLFGKSR